MKIKVASKIEKLTSDVLEQIIKEEDRKRAPNQDSGMTAQELAEAMGFYRPNHRIYQALREAIHQGRLVARRVMRVRIDGFLGPGIEYNRVDDAPTPITTPIKGEDGPPPPTGKRRKGVPGKGA